jgi:hypothetical protein
MLLFKFMVLAKYNIKIFGKVSYLLFKAKFNCYISIYCFKFN